jgi:DNA-binding Lrp family transcriptional regulator
MSRLEDYEWMLHYLKALDPINAKIIEGLGEHPRNLSLLAEKIDLPSSTVAFRLKALIKQGYLTVRAKLNSPRLGLMKAAIVADTNRGFSDTLLKAIENVGYWSYTAGCYGKFNGFYGLFSFPFAYKAEFEDYFERAKMLGATSNYALLWTTNIYEVAPNFDWFDFKRKAWNFAWQEWVDEVSRTSDILPQRLMDPERYEVEVDYLDLLILKELEKDGFRDFTQLSKVVKITPQAVRHRYYQHVIGRNLITGYEVAVFPYPLQVSDLGAFVFNFPNQEALAKFANSLVDKPFVLSYAKVIGKNSLLVHSYVPKIEFSNFMESLNRLIVEEIIRDFYYVSIDVKSFKRQTVSYEYFRDGKWEYNQAEEIEKLIEMMPLKLKTHSS